MTSPSLTSAAADEAPVAARPAGTDQADQRDSRRVARAGRATFTGVQLPHPRIQPVLHLQPRAGAHRCSCLP